VYKINDLLNRIKNNDTTYIVNFWATWCKPCVQELPAFDSLLTITKNSRTKIILVSLDFKEDIEKDIRSKQTFKQYYMRNVRFEDRMKQSDKKKAR
jgi:thiol-disulfide isomerase/thioredoxin